jgi:hypothetical protein
MHKHGIQHRARARPGDARREDNGAMLSVEDAAELAALRRRAFAPGADIHDDPAALARLAELESAALPAPVAEPVPAEARARERARSVAASGAEVAGEPLAGADHAGAEHGAADHAAGAHTDPALADAAPTASSTAASPAAAPPAADVRPPRRRRWPARAVVAVAVPAAALALAGGFAAGMGSNGPAAEPTPTPTAPRLEPQMQFANSYAWARFARKWDIESLRVLTQIDSARIWSGTIGAGTTTCVAIDDQLTNPIACAPTSDVRDMGIVIQVAAPDATTETVYTINPYSDPMVTVEHFPGAYGPGGSDGSDGG